jgi:YVTN family beta-propeller protein
MKTIKISAIAGVLAMGLFSCMKDNMNMSTPSPELNINYPAAYIVNGQSNDVYVISLETNTVKEVIKLGEMADASHDGMNMSTGISWPHHIYLNPAKTLLSIGVPGMDLSAGHSGGMAGMKGKIALVDAVKGKVTKVLDLPVMNHNAAFSSDGSEIWTAQMEESGKVLVYDANNYTLKKTIAVGGQPAEVTFSSDGTMAFAANGHDSSVTVINASTKEVMATLKVGADPVGAWAGSDGNMYVDNEEGKSISIINVATMSVTGTIDLGFMPGFAAYNSQMKELWVTDPDNGKVHYWTFDSSMKMWMHGSAFETGKGAHAIAFTKDEMTAYITNQTANTVSVVEVMSHKETKEIPVGTKPNGIVIK